jgi:hypothetical protein
VVTAGKGDYEERGAMDEQQAQKVNEAAQKFAEALAESYRNLSDRSVSAQALNAELTQSFFNAVIGNLYHQAESNREMDQELVEQARRGQESAQVLAQESVSAHMDFLDSLFFYYRRSMEEAERSSIRR